MSIKKFGQGGEYLHFSVKKKFYSLVFFDNKNVFDFAGFLHRNFIKSKSNLSYIIRTIFLLSITTLLFLFVITITLCKKNSLLFLSFVILQSLYAIIRFACARYLQTQAWGNRLSRPVIAWNYLFIQ